METILSPERHPRWARDGWLDRSASSATRAVKARAQLMATGAVFVTTFAPSAPPELLCR